jgi:glycosyltransferase involved in cell wall biosynthesis
MPLISIIINCYNGSKYLNDCLKSVYSQTYVNYEVIFFDNNSNDNSKNIFFKFKQSKDKYFFSEKLLNLGDARKQAVNLSSSGYVAFIDVDDIWHPKKIEKQFSYMLSKNAYLSFSNVNLLDEDKFRLGKSNIQLNDVSRENLLKKYQIYMPSVIIKKTENNFLPDLCYCPDFLLFMTYIFKFKYVFIEDYLATYRYHSNSYSNKIGKVQFLEELITFANIKKNFCDGNINLVKACYNRLGSIMINRALYYAKFNNNANIRSLLKKKVLGRDNFFRFIGMYILKRDFIRVMAFAKNLRNFF